MKKGNARSDAMGVPVITSDAGAITGITGEAALLYQPIGI